MKLESLKDLKAMIKLCRSMGVSAIEVDGVKLELGDAPAQKLNSEQPTEAEAEPMYTDEQILMWSSGGLDG